MYFVVFRFLPHMASEIDGVVEAPRTRCAVNGSRDLRKESLKLLDATAHHLELDMRDQVSPGYASPCRGFPARQVENAMPIVAAGLQVPSNVGGTSEIGVTNRTGTTALLLIEKLIQSFRTLGAVFD